MKKRFSFLNSLLFLVLFIVPNTVIAQDGKIKVAVLDFKTIGDNSNLGEGAAEIMRTALAGTGKYSVVERGMLKQILEEQKLGQSGVVDQKTAVGIGKVLGAKFVAVGSVVKFGEKYTLNIRFVNVETGEVLEGKQLTANNQEQIPDLCLEMVKFFSGGVKSEIKNKKPEIKTIQKQNIVNIQNRQFNTEWALGILYPGVALKRIRNKHAWEIRVQSGSGIFAAGPRYYRYLKNSEIKLFWGLEADYINFKGNESEGVGFAFGGFTGGEIPLTPNIKLNMDIGPMYISLSENDYSQSVSGLEYFLNMGIYWHF